MDWPGRAEAGAGYGPPVDRRTELAEGALGYVLSEGLVGLSLRPLAAELGTSDRMLIYHFGSKERLIAEILTRANRRVAAAIEADRPPPMDTAGEFVRYAWSALRTPDTLGAVRLYLEMCVLSVRDPQQWAEAHAMLRDPWLAMLREGLTELGLPAPRIPALADLILDTIDGLLLDRMVTGDPARADAAAAEFADLMEHATR